MCFANEVVANFKLENKLNKGIIYINLLEKNLITAARIANFKKLKRKKNKDIPKELLEMSLEASKLYLLIYMLFNLLNNIFLSFYQLKKRKK